MSGSEQDPREGIWDRHSGVYSIWAWLKMKALHVWTSSINSVLIGSGLYGFWAEMILEASSSRFWVIVMFYFFIV